MLENCNCGSTEQVELVHDEINGIVAEADFFCKACRSHLGLFSYGSWHAGTGQTMTKIDEAKAARALRNLIHVQRKLVA